MALPMHRVYLQFMYLILCWRNKFQKKQQFFCYFAIFIRIVVLETKSTITILFVSRAFFDIILRIAIPNTNKIEINLGVVLGFAFMFCLY